MRFAFILTLSLALAAPAVAGEVADDDQAARKRLSADVARARENGRPVWVAHVDLDVDVTDDRREMRRAVDIRLHKGKTRQAIKILYTLIDQGSGKAKDWAQWYLPQALVWAEEYAHAILLYRQRQRNAFTCLQLGRCYLHYDLFDSAVEIFETGLQKLDDDRPLLEAKLRWGIGDAHRARGKTDTAAEAYQRAIDALEKELDGDAPGWYADNLRRRLTWLRFLLKMCTAGSLEMEDLQPGTYTASARGYDGPVEVTVDVDDGRITDVRVTSHRESLPLDALTVVPRRIVREQTPSVDAVTGATVTSVGVMGAVLKAIGQAKSDE